MKIERIETGARMNKAVIHGETVYLAGFIAVKTVDAALASRIPKSSRSLTATWRRPARQVEAPQGNDLALGLRTVEEMNKAWDAWGRAALRRPAPASRRCCKAPRKRWRFR